MTEEKIYDCTKMEDFKKYKEELKYKYNDYSVEELKSYCFMVQTKSEQRKTTTPSAMMSLTLSFIAICISVIINLINIEEIEKIKSNCIILIFVMIFILFIYNIKIWSKENIEYHKRLSMLKLEKYVLEEMIEEKNINLVKNTYIVTIEEKE